MSRSKSLPEAFRQCHGMMLELNLTNFSAHLTARNGFAPRCRTCTAELRRLREKQAAMRITRAPERKVKRIQLKPGQICDRCCNLAHRVEGANCRRCGLAYEALPPVELVFRRSYREAM